MHELTILTLWLVCFLTGASGTPTKPMHWAQTATSRSQPISPVSITKLPDGIAITAGESLRQAIATWNVYVTLEPPKSSDVLFAKVAALEATIHNIASLDWTFKDNMANYKTRQQYMMTTLRKMRPSRQKRGLLDIGGSLLNVLFGVATSSQVARLTGAVKEIEGQNQAICHAVNHLSTIVNQTRNYLRQVTAKQEHMDQQLTRLTTAMTNLAAKVDANSRRLFAVELLNQLDCYMDILMLATSQERQNMDRYRLQQQELALGHLTRELLSEQALNEILTQAGHHYQKVSQLSWYFMHLSVTPVRHPDLNLIMYKIEIPLFSDAAYLMYNIYAFGTPVNSSDLLVTIDVQNSYGYDTRTGRVFLNHNCVGHNPIICMNGPQYEDQVLLCAKGLITHNTDLIKECKVSIEHTDRTARLTTISTNQYALASWSEQVLVRCAGQPQTTHQIETGLYNLTCNQPCQISGKGWSINCIDQMHLEKTVAAALINVTAHFNFSGAPKISTIDLKLAQQYRQMDLPPLQADATYLLSQPELTTKLDMSWANIWINSALILCLWLLSAFICIKGRCILSKIKARLVKQSPSQPPKIMPEEYPLTAPAREPLAQLPAIEAARHLPALPVLDSRASIWPILPSFQQCMAARQDS